MTYILEPYDDALQEILKKGVRKPNRTKADAITIFGVQRRYDISERFPLLTKRKVWPKAIFAELLWMLSGSTNNKDLQALGSNIWTPWVDPEFEKKHGYAEGCFGPVYGFQLRHFGGNYGNGIGGDPALWNGYAYGRVPDIHWDAKRARKATTGVWRDGRSQNVYGKNGTCQITYMMKMLRENPNSRRIMFSLWNPRQLNKMRLPPCHYTYQLYVENDTLSGHLTQRSCDFPVGVPANIQFYSALTYMFAQQAGYHPAEFVHTTVDSHIYVNQVEQVEEYLARPKHDSPKLKLNRADDMLSYNMESFEVQDYKHEKPIKIPVEV